ASERAKPAAVFAIGPLVVTGGAQVVVVLPLPLEMLQIVVVVVATDPLTVTQISVDAVLLTVVEQPPLVSPLPAVKLPSTGASTILVGRMLTPVDRFTVSITPGLAGSGAAVRYPPWFAKTKPEENPVVVSKVWTLTSDEFNR